uniref:DUF4205 domain-containing protein n=1 Tax=Macrostomum lignano TaxID=282301 RepID=A0A1I8FPZ4_9PLAT
MPGCWTGPASSSRAVVDWSARTKCSVLQAPGGRASPSGWANRHRIGASSTYCDRLLRQLLSRHAEILACCDGHPVAEDSATTGAIDGRGVDEEACNGIGDNSSAFVDLLPAELPSSVSSAPALPPAQPPARSLGEVFANCGASFAFAFLRRAWRSSGPAAGHEDSGADLAMCQELLDDMLRQVEQLPLGRGLASIGASPADQSQSPWICIFERGAAFLRDTRLRRGGADRGAPSLPGAIGASALSGER